MMLEVRDLNAYYGKSHILHGVNFTLEEGEVVSLLGRNGVGRSTTVKSIMGEVPPHGSIRFRGNEIAGLPNHKISRLGLGYVPENRDIFPTLTVRQNLELGVKNPRKPGRCSRCSPTWRSARTPRRACCPAVKSRCSPSAAP